MANGSSVEHDFVEGEEYTRQEIHDVMGGELETYLPQKNKRIVCGAFTTNLNPGVPDVLLVGNGPNVVMKGEMLCEQVDPIPIFVKKSNGRWVYRGDYVASDWTEDRRVIKQQEKAAGRDDVVRVIYLKRIR